MKEEIAAVASAPVAVFSGLGALVGFTTKVAASSSNYISAESDQSVFFSPYRRRVCECELEGDERISEDREERKIFRLRLGTLHVNPGPWTQKPDESLETMKTAYYETMYTDVTLGLLTSFLFSLIFRPSLADNSDGIKGICHIYDALLSKSN